MPRRFSSPAGRALIFLLFLTLAISIAFDLLSADSILLSLWDSLFSRGAPVEGVRDGMIDRLRIRR